MRKPNLDDVTVHHLKTWPKSFQAIVDLVKRHDIRRNDRDFKVGDLVVLWEYIPSVSEQELPESWGPLARGHYTGRCEVREISYVTEGGEYGLPFDRCVLSIRQPRDPVVIAGLVSDCYGYRNGPPLALVILD